MCPCILADSSVFVGLVSGAPEYACSGDVATSFGHTGSQYLHRRMGIGREGSTLEYLRGVLVILKFRVIDEPQVVIKPPVVWIVGDAILHQLDRALRFARTVRGGRGKKTGAEFVGGDQLRIECCSDFEQRSKLFVGLRPSGVPGAEVLHRARPIKARHQPVEPETRLAN